MGPGKEDAVVCCRVTRHPRVFRRLTGCQWTPGFWGVTIFMKHHIHCNKHALRWSGYIGILFYLMHNKQTRIAMLEKLTCCVGVYAPSKMPQPQKLDSRFGAFVAISSDMSLKGHLGVNLVGRYPIDQVCSRYKCFSLI